MKFKTGTATKVKTKGYDEDEEDEDDAPRSRRDSVRAPKIKRRAKSREERDEEDDDDTPDEERATVRKGWSGAKETRAEGSKYADDLKLTKEPQIIRFLDSEPFEAFRQHWVERKGKKSFTCIGPKTKNKVGKDCPLCAMGVSARAMARFYVVVLDPDNDPVLHALTAGPMLTDQLESYHKNEITGPLKKLYYALSITGKKKSTNYPQVSIKARDLEEDYGISPLTKEELAAFREQTATFQGVYRNTYSELVKIAKGSVGEDDDEEDDVDDDDE